MVNQQLLSRFAGFATGFSLVVIMLGAFTRLTDAGLGCPDWPGCYGHLILSLNAKTQLKLSPHIEFYKAWAEMLHRYFVLGLSSLIFCIISMICIFKPLRNLTNSVLALSLVACLVMQILLGQWTVTLQLQPLIVTSHLLGGYSILALLWCIYLNNTTSSRGLLMRPVGDQPAKSSYLRFLAALAIALLICQILLGAWTSTNYAALSCTHFPSCMQLKTMVWHWQSAFNVFLPLGLNYDGGIFSEEVRQTIQMAHRLGALVLSSYLIGFSLLCGLSRAVVPATLNLIYGMLSLLCLQICLGITNVIFKLPILTALLHNLVAALLLLCLIALLFSLSSAQNLRVSA